MQYCLGKLWYNFTRQITETTNRTARVLTFSNYDADVDNIFELLGWKNLTCQRQIQRATMVYKSLHGLVPEYLRSRFVNCDTAYSLRDSESKINVPLPRTNYYKNSFNYSGAVLWNSLPCEVRQAKSLKQFKQLINGIF